MGTCPGADKKWGSAYLTRDFFDQLQASMPDRVLLVMAFEGDKPVAGALNLIGSRALFGRNWGCAWDLDVKFLHFELCYYQVNLPASMSQHQHAVKTPILLLNLCAHGN